MKEKLVKLLIKHVNVKGLLKELVAETIDEALDKVVADSKNPYDNVAKASLYPVIEEKLLEVIDEKIDLEKIFGIKKDA